VENEGLGALFFGVFRNGEKLLASLDVPGGYELIGAVAIGKPVEGDSGRSAERPPAEPRRDRAPRRLAGRPLPAVTRSAPSSRRIGAKAAREPDRNRGMAANTRSGVVSACADGGC
jgi:hypothetical protein